MFLIGVITSTTTSLGDKTNAALRMVGLVHKDDIPKGYESLIRPGTTGPGAAGTPVPVAPVDHGLIGNWAHAMASDHPVLLLVLAALIGLYVLSKARQVAAVLAPRRNSPQRFPAPTALRSHHLSHPGSYSRYRKD